MHVYEVLLRPIVSEKNTMLLAKNKYAFEVLRDANKPQIKESVETAFKVKVAAVNVVNVRGKIRRMGKHQGMTASWKKAIVTLKPGFKIELFEGV